MKLLHLCVTAAIAAGVAASPHIARAQALGEAGALSAGTSSAGSASGATLGNAIGRTMNSEGRRIHSSGKTSTSGGVVNLHWSREELGRSAKSARRPVKRNSRRRSEKAKPDFVILGADPPDGDSDDAPVSRPRAAHPSASQVKPSRDNGSSAHGGKNKASASHPAS